MRHRRVVRPLLGAAVVGAFTVGAAAGLYYAFLPAHPGPENSSPPPEGIGLIYGAVLGCAAGVVVVVVATRSLATALQAFGVAAVVGAGCWLLLGSGSVDDVVAGIVVCGIGAALGLVAGVAAMSLRRPTRRR